MLNTTLKTLVALLFLTLATSLWGGVAGVYRVDAAALQAAIKLTPDFEAAPKGHQEMMLEAADQMKLELTLSEKGTFDATSEMMGSISKASGTYSVSTCQLELATTFENGEPKKQPEVIQLQRKGGALVISEPGMPFPFVLRKEE